MSWKVKILMELSMSDESCKPMQCAVPNWEAVSCTSLENWGSCFACCVGTAPCTLEVGTQSCWVFFIATTIEVASYKMILQVLCIQLLYQRKFYVCKLVYLETEAVKETSENRAAIKEVCTMPIHYYILKTV